MKRNQIEREPAGRHTLEQLIGLLFAVLMVVVLTACKQEAKAPTDSKDAKVTTDINPVGTYALVSVNGKNVPTTIAHEGHDIPIASGSFAINADGSCSSKMFLSGRDAAIETKAAYTRDGTNLTMQWEGAGTTVGTVEGNTFTMNNEGMVLLYRK